MFRAIYLLLMLSSCVFTTTEISNHFVDSVCIKTNKVPLFKEKENNFVFTIKIYNSSNKEQLSINNIKLNLDKPELLEEIKIVASENIAIKAKDINPVTNINGEIKLAKGENIFYVSIRPKESVNLTAKLNVSIPEINGSDGWKHIPKNAKGVFRMGTILRSAGQDNIHTYRIPGLTITNKGTLIAVYDNRYNNKYDLQEDIDVGMSRSSDGGETWEPMKIIMDMGEWGEKPQNENGIGDPCVLFDNIKNTIWVAALWVHGHPGARAWSASEPGLEPAETGQFMLVKSEDDGITWSAPINITKQIKNPEWQLLLQGPGMGITMKNGTLVFPAQFKDKDQIPYSTIIYSEDHRTTWHIGTGAKSNTTEAQVVELSDGSLMLNMRDNRNKQEKGDNNGRAVAITSDMGQTWETHPSSNSALPESTCMASFISADLSINGTKQKVLFFSNPNNKKRRKNMTIKTSMDEGKTWPVKCQVLLNEEPGYGYSCLTMIDDKTIGILYEGVNELYFQKILVMDLLKEE